MRRCAKKFPKLVTPPINFVLRCPSGNFDLELDRGQLESDGAVVCAELLAQALLTYLQAFYVAFRYTDTEPGNNACNVVW